MKKSEILKDLLETYLECAEILKTDRQLKTVYCFGLLSEQVRQILHDEGMFKNEIQKR